MNEAKQVKPGPAVRESMSFFVPGKVTAKGRHRSYIAKGKGGKQFVKTYTPTATASREGDIAACFMAEVGGGWVPLDVPVEVSIQAHFPIPKAWTKKRRAVMKQFPELEPCPKHSDADNIAKIVCDGLNQVAWLDDRQVWALHCYKVYSERPGYYVSLEWEDAG